MKKILSFFSRKELMRLIILALGSCGVPFYVETMRIWDTHTTTFPHTLVQLPIGKYKMHLQWAIVGIKRVPWLVSDEHKSGCGVRYWLSWLEAGDVKIGLF